MAISYENKKYMKILYLKKNCFKYDPDRGMARHGNRLGSYETASP